MRAPGALRRFSLLIGLKFRLTFRAMADSAGRIVAYVLGWLVMLAMAGGFGAVTYGIAATHPELYEPYVHLVFLSVFLMQLCLGVMSFVSAEFYDVSRLLHLPLSYREVFAAMSVGTLLSPMALLYLSPGLGLVLAGSGDGGLAAWRLLIWVGAILFGNSLALTINLGLLTVFTRRRLRDVATLFVGLLLPAFYIASRHLLNGGNDGELTAMIASDPTASLRWLPTAWAGELFLTQQPVARLAGYAMAFGGFGLGVAFAGSRAVKLAFLGHLAPPGDRELEKGGAALRTRWQRDFVALVRLARTLFFREPQLKALYLQQTVFLLAPVFYMQLQESGTPDLVLLAMIPFMLSLSHVALSQSLFGMDGRGMGQLLLSPIARQKLILARVFAWATIFFVADFVVLVVALLILGFLRDDPLHFSGLLPQIYIAVVIFDLVILALGAVSSVVWPVRLSMQGRRAIQGQRTSDQGCSAGLVRMMLFMPGCFLGAVFAFVSLAPLPPIDLLPRSFALITLPLGLGLAVGTVLLVVWSMARRLRRYEERIYRALVDVGE